MASESGRSKTATVLWPPHTPIHTIVFAILAVLVAFGTLATEFILQTPLQKFYTPAYLWSSLPSVAKAQHKYQLLYIAGAHGQVRLTDEADVVDGRTQQPKGRPLHVQASPKAVAAGWITVFRGTETTYSDAAFNSWLRSTIYQDASPAALYEESGLVGLAFFLLMLPVSIPKDIARRKLLKYGRRLKGPVLLTPKEFIQEVEGDGIGFQTTGARKPLRIPRNKEAQHMLMVGDTGAGKSSLIRQLLVQIAERGETAIVHDPACEYIQQFFDESRGDIVLNPLDARCPYWSPSDELNTLAEADALAESLYQPISDERRDEFFTQTPAQIFGHLLKYKPTPTELVQWMADPLEIEKRIEGTEIAQFIDREAGAQRAGVLASLGLKAKTFRLLPTMEEAGKRTWTASAWAKKRKGWIFITSRPAERDALRPLVSLWIDLLVMRLLSAPDPGQKPVWFVIDELASLQKLPKLHTAITENRKSGNPIVLGFQGKAQLEVIYGHLAEVMMSQPATKIFLKTTEPKASEWVSKAIGSVEIERLKETKLDGSRSGKSFNVDRQIDPLVMESEISGLDDLNAYLKIGNNVAHFAFEYLDLPNRTAPFLRRYGASDSGFAALKLPSEAAATPATSSDPKASKAIAPQPALSGAKAL